MVFDSRYFLYLFGGQNGAPNTYNWTDISARSTRPIFNPAYRALTPGTPTAGNSNSSSSGLSGGAIAGIVIGSVAGAVLCLMVLICLFRQRRAKKTSTPAGQFNDFNDAENSRTSTAAPRTAAVEMGDR